MSCPLLAREAVLVAGREQWLGGCRGGCDSGKVEDGVSWFLLGFFSPVLCALSGFK